MLPSISILMAMSIMVNIDASVIIHQTGVDVGSDSYECGEQLVLSCQINGYLVSMSWQNDSSSVPFAQCVYDMCTLDSTVNNIFEFTRNTTIGLFNLIFNVTNYNKGVIYTCSDGSTIDSSRVLTKDYRPTFNETMERQLKAMSGCVNQSVRIEFKWKKVQASSMEETEYNPTYVDNNPTIDTTACLSDTECGAADAIQHIRTIEAEPGGLSDYHLKVIVIYDGFSMESFATKETYKVKVCGLIVKDIIYKIIIIICLVTDLILCVVYFWLIFSKDTRDCFYTKTDSENVDKERERKHILWRVNAGKYVSFIPLCASSILILVNYIPCDTADACSSCEFWRYLGVSQCGCLIIHAIAVIVIIKSKTSFFKGSKTFVRDVQYVRSLFFFNVLEFIFLFGMWIYCKCTCVQVCVFSPTITVKNPDTPKEKPASEGQDSTRVKTAPPVIYQFPEFAGKPSVQVKAGNRKKIDNVLDPRQNQDIRKKRPRTRQTKGPQQSQKKTSNTAQKDVLCSNISQVPGQGDKHILTNDQCQQSGARGSVDISKFTNSDQTNAKEDPPEYGSQIAGQGDRNSNLEDQVQMNSLRSRSHTNEPSETNSDPALANKNPTEKSPTEIKNPKHVDVKPEQQLPQARDTTANSGKLTSGISAVIPVEQYENTKC